MNKQNVELKVRNPRGVIEPPKAYGLAPRFSDLAGKKIALIHNEKAGASTFLDVVEGLLKANYSGMTFLRQYSTAINLAREASFYDEIARSSDAFIFGSGD